MLMKILNTLLVLCGLALALFITTRTFRIPHKANYKSPDAYVFQKGNADPETRRQIEQKLLEFQQGYDARDTSILHYYMDDLFSHDNVLILGTMPLEIYVGFDAASELVRTDWLQWGDVRLLVHNANISTHEDVAWISTIGYVKTDLSRFLVLPLRFTGVMVREEFGWKFQQAQYQFDLDSSFTILAILLLGFLTLGTAIRFIQLFYRYLVSRDK
jgi:hypothetical protein